MVTDFTGETATAVQIKLVPADDQAVVSVKDVDIEACIEKGNHLFGAVLRQYKRKNNTGVGFAMHMRATNHDFLYRNENNFTSRVESDDNSAVRSPVCLHIHDNVNYHTHE